jgi:pilus assembly protein CpaE
MPESSLRILLISSDEAVRDELGRVVTSSHVEHQLFWISEPTLAADRVDELIPHVIFVDDALGGRDPVPLIRRLVASVSGATVLALVREDATRDAAQVVLAGAKGFATKPLIEGDVVATLRQVMAPGRVLPDEEAAATSDGRVIVLCAPKGGTGRTTLAINLAAALRKLSEEPVALVDADYAAPALDVALNVDSQRDISDLLPRLSRLDEQLIEAVLREHALGMKVLLAPPPADLSSRIPLPKVQRILVVLKRMFPWVVVDLGLPLDETAFAFLDSADRIIVSALPEMVGLRNTRLLLEELHERGYPDYKVSLVLNRSDLKGGVPKRDIQDHLKVEFEHTIPDDQPLVTHSINRGVPVVVSHRRSAVARAVRGVAQKLIEDLSPELDVSDGGPLRRGSRRVRAVFKKSGNQGNALLTAGVLGPLLLRVTDGSWRVSARIGWTSVLADIVPCWWRG